METATEMKQHFSEKAMSFVMFNRDERTKTFGLSFGLNSK